MTIHFLCPSCRHRLQADSVLKDAAVRCPACSATLEVPSPPSVPAAPAMSARWTVPPPPPPVAEEITVHFRSIRREEETEMDMTPMVDVTFLLLIFFMVTAAFTLQKSFEVPAPDEDVVAEQSSVDWEQDRVVVRVDEFNTYHVTAPTSGEEIEVVTDQELLVRLREAVRGDAANTGTARMIVMAHGSATHEKVVTAMDAGNEVGVEEVRLVTVEDDQ